MKTFNQPILDEDEIQRLVRVYEYILSSRWGGKGAHQKDENDLTENSSDIATKDQSRLGGEQEKITDHVDNPIM